MSDTREPDDESLSSADARLLAVYGEMSRETPSQHVDDALRAAARRSVNARPRALGAFPWRQWRAPLAMAATVILSATVVYWNVRDHGIEKFAEPVREPAPGIAGPGATSSATPSQGDARRERDHATNKEAESVKSQPALTAPDAAPARAERPAHSSADASSVAPAPERDRQVQPQVREETPAAAPATPPPAEPDLAPDESRPLDEVKKELRTQQRLASPRAAASGAAAAPGAEYLERALADKADAVHARLEVVRKLMEAGKQTQAMEAIRALRRDHPEFELPEDIARYVKEAESSR